MISIIKGKVFPKTFFEAKRLYEQAADAGNVLAIYKLAECLFHGRGVVANVERAIELCHDAADKGLTLAIFELAMFYEHGVGVPKDRKHSWRLYVRAAELGNTEAEERCRLLRNLEW